ncbi:MAG TPA: 2'-5' RNA ligase family protein [Acidimicrobiales bacterium]|nr:2'-5' RNA ligase family protein [Acidimicrobiales bacterium]
MNPERHQNVSRPEDRSRLSSFLHRATRGLVYLSSRRRARAVVRDRAIPPGDSGAHLTCVVGLPAAVALELFSSVAPLRECDPRQHHYPAASMHFTVLNLDGCPQERAERAVGAAVAATGPLRARVARFGVGPETVYAELDVGPELRRLRGRIARASHRRIGRPKDRLLGGLAVVNVVRFTAPVEPALVPAVAGLGALSLEFDVPAVDLVLTDRVMSAESTTLLGRFPLGG